MLNCINDRRMMFCALYKYLNSDNRCYAAEYVHQVPKKYHDCDAVIRFTTIDPDSADLDNPEMHTLYVWISFYHGMVILDPETNEMMTVGEKQLELYKQINGYWTTRFIVNNALQSKQLKDIYEARIFHPVFNIINDLTTQINDKKYEEAISDFCDETEKNMRILPPYHIIDPTCTWREKRAATNCRYMMAIGLIELMKRLSTHLDRLYIPTTVDGGADIKTDFRTFTDTSEVYWAKVYRSSTRYGDTALVCTCRDNGTIRLKVPGFEKVLSTFAEYIEIIQLDHRAFICMPFPEVNPDDMETLKSIADERWCQIFRQELTEYMIRMNINNECTKENEECQI